MDTKCYPACLINIALFKFLLPLALWYVCLYVFCILFFIFYFLNFVLLLCSSLAPLHDTWFLYNGCNLFLDQLITYSLCLISAQCMC